MKSKWKRTIITGLSVGLCLSALLILPHLAARLPVVFGTASFGLLLFFVAGSVAAFVAQHNPLWAGVVSSLIANASILTLTFLTQPIAPLFTWGVQSLIFTAVSIAGGGIVLAVSRRKRAAQPEN